MIEKEKCVVVFKGALSEETRRIVANYAMLTPGVFIYWIEDLADIGGMTPELKEKICRIVVPGVKPPALDGAVTLLNNARVSPNITVREVEIEEVGNSELVTLTSEGWKTLSQILLAVIENDEGIVDTE